MSRNAVRITVILSTLATEALLYAEAIFVAIGKAESGRDELELVVRLLLVQMPILAIGALACIIGRPWPTRLAILVGFLLLGIDSAMIAVGLASAGQFDWTVIFTELPAVIVLGGAWLVARAKSKPRVISDPPTGEWR